MDLFPVIPEDLSALSVEDLTALEVELSEAVNRVLADPAAAVSEDFSSEDVFEAVTAAVESLEAIRAELSEEETEEAEAETEETTEEEPAEESNEEAAATPEAFAALAARVAETAAVEETETAEVETTEVEVEKPLTASAKPNRRAPRKPLPAPARNRRPLAEPVLPRVSITAAAPNLGYDVGESLPDEVELARMMERSRKNFGMIAAGTHGEKIPIARADWSELYPDERRLGSDPFRNMELIAAATSPAVIREMMEQRKTEGLTASGGLCAPVTPYYQLQMISVADRPVRAALPAFNADRGGIRFARPAGLSDITTAVGVRTAAEDAAGGTEATKTCQVVDCPDFEESDVQILFHCLQFGNLGARTFPERVAQWNNLVLAAHARLAESELLTGIDTASTAVSASNLGLGASASLPSQVLTAAAGMRSRNRMSQDAVLRVMLPSWVLDLLVSDVYRSQFQRFDMDAAAFVALLREANVEPTFYIDGANGAAQVFGDQDAGALLSFPDEVRWYLYPEGSFLFVDGGVLELGLVRDSVLNRTNDFQIFGESFENVAFVGVESLAITSPLCDTGVVSSPADGPDCPIDYTVAG